MNAGDDVDEKFQSLESDIREYLSQLRQDASNPLSYLNLSKEGRIDLVSPIMDAGGYIAVSERLGIPVEESQFISATINTENKVPQQLFLQEDRGASLAIGSSLESKLSDIDEVMKEEDTSTSNQMISKSAIREQVPSGADLVILNRQLEPPPVAERAAEGETMALTAPLRLGILTLAVVATLGFGKTSTGIISSEFVTICRSVTVVLSCAHLLLAFYAGTSTAPQMNRNAFVWFVKVLLGGPLSFNEMRSMDSLKNGA